MYVYRVTEWISRPSTFCDGVAIFTPKAGEGPRSPDPVGGGVREYSSTGYGLRFSTKYTDILIYYVYIYITYIYIYMYIYTYIHIAYVSLPLYIYIYI